MAAICAAKAQQVAKVPTIGFLGQLSSSAMSKWTAAFVQRLRELGWVEGRTVCDRVPLGRGAQRPLRGSRSRVGPAKGRCHRHRRDRRNQPGLRRLAILANIGNAAAALEMRQVEVAAATFGLEVTSLEIRRAEDVAPAIEPLKGHADGLYVVTEALANTNRFEINSLALGARLSTMHAEKGYVEAGGLMSYGPSFPDLYQRAALYVDK